MINGDKYAELIDSGLRRPQLVATAKRDRQRPSNLLGPHDKMFIIAADHTARGALAAGPNPLAMGDRRELLTRLCRALERPAVNGVLGSADILEELLLLGALEGKTVFGSMNRGGIVGSVFEADDRFTGYTASALASSRFEGGKMLLKITPEDPLSARTLEACAPRGRRVGRAEPAGHDRTLHVCPDRQHAGERPQHRGSGQVGGDRVGLGNHRCAHLAETTQRRRHGAGAERLDPCRPSSSAAKSARTRTRRWASGRRL